MMIGAPMHYQEYIEITPGKRSGKPCLKKTRITVYDVLGWLANGTDEATILEDYPELKADANFRQLQDELADTENQIQYARRFYNGAVRNLNTRIQSFPHLLIARPLSFKPAQFFTVDDKAERSAVRVKLK